MKVLAVTSTISLITAVGCASPRSVERGDLVRIALRPGVSEAPLEGRVIALHPYSIVVRSEEGDVERALARGDVLKIHVARPGYRRAIRITGCAMTALGALLPFLADPDGALGWSVWAIVEAQVAWGCISPPDIWRPALLPPARSHPTPR